MNAEQEEIIWKHLDTFEIEIPSWGFAQTGTRFGKFVQPGAAVTIEHKMSDAGQVHKLTGCCPGVAVHVLWDFPQGKGSAPEVRHSGVASLGDPEPARHQKTASPGSGARLCGRAPRCTPVRGAAPSVSEGSSPKSLR